MKFIHTSDIHLDSPLTARLGPTKTKQRKRELIDSFRGMVREAEEMGAGAIIIAGDLFDNDKTGIRTIDTVIGIIEGAADLTFFYLSGNHEKDRILSSGISLPSNLKIFGENWTYFEIAGITVAGRSRTSCGMFDSLELDPQKRNVVVLHGELRDKSDENGKIGIKEFCNLPIDYLALGHYHTYNEVVTDSGCYAVYSGTPEGRGFDETGDKGYVIVDVTDRGVFHRFQRRAKRRLHIIEVDITGANRDIDIENRIAKKLSQIPFCDMVRVCLTGEHEPESNRNTEALELRFASDYYYLEVKDLSKLRINADDYKNDLSLKGEFIRLVLSKSELSESEKNEIIECGIRALAKEEI